MPEIWLVAAMCAVILVPFVKRDSAGLPAGAAVVGLVLALLATLSVVSYIHVIPHLLRDRDYTFAAIATAEILVIALAASGVLVGIGH